MQRWDHRYSLLRRAADVHSSRRLGNDLEVSLEKCWERGKRELESHWPCPRTIREENSKFIFSSQQLVKHLTGHKWSWRTSPLIQGWEQVVWAVKHLQNKFSWSHDRLWQEQENKKSGRSHDQGSGLPRGPALPARSSLLAERSGKAGLRVNTPCQWHHLIK